MAIDLPVFKSSLPKGAFKVMRVESSESNRLTISVQGPSGAIIQKKWSVGKNILFDVWRTPDYDWFLTVAELNGVELMLELLEV